MLFGTLICICGKNSSMRETEGTDTVEPVITVPESVLDLAECDTGGNVGVAGFDLILEPTA